MEIQEEIVENWDIEAEPLNWLSRDTVQAAGGLTFDVKAIVKRTETSAAGKPYTAYRIYCKNEFTEYVIGNVMRSNMKWDKTAKAIKKIHVSVEKTGEFTNWVIKQV